MFKLKTILAAALAAVSLSSWACWFTTDNFNSNYIAGVNNYSAHYSRADALSGAVYRNGQSVALPLTVLVKVSPRYPDQTGEAAGAKPVIKAILQYKVKHSGTWGAWVTVRRLENPDWSMNWDHPVTLFGRNNIDPAGISSGDEIMIRLYLSDGTYETGDPSSDITSTVADNATSSTGSYEGGWTAPFVFRVVWNGKRRAAR